MFSLGKPGVYVGLVRTDKSILKVNLIYLMIILLNKIIMTN